MFIAALLHTIGCASLRSCACSCGGTYRSRICRIHATYRSCCGCPYIRTTVAVCTVGVRSLRCSTASCVSVVHRWSSVISVRTSIMSTVWRIISSVRSVVDHTSLHTWSAVIDMPRLLGIKTISAVDIAMAKET
jgi:hypothetical protein